MKTGSKLSSFFSLIALLVGPSSMAYSLGTITCDSLNDSSAHLIINWDEKSNSITVSDAKTTSTCKYVESCFDTVEQTLIHMNHYSVADWGIGSTLAFNQEFLQIQRSYVRQKTGYAIAITKADAQPTHYHCRLTHYQDPDHTADFQ